MNTPIRTALALATLAVAAQASAQVTFYETEQFGGRSFTADREVRNLKRFGFNDAASSAVVDEGRWEVCDQTRFEGNCRVLRPGSYPSLRAMGLNNRISSVQGVGPDERVADGRYAPLPRVAGPSAVFYAQEQFRGPSFKATGDVPNFRRYGFNDAASSVIVNSGPIEVCNGAGFRGRCVMLAAGRYPSLSAIGLNDRVSSVRAPERVADARPQPMPTVPGVTFYEREGFAGRSFNTERPVANFQRFGFNDLASSAVVVGAPWEVCPANGFAGACVVLPPGDYPTLRSMGLNNRVSSVRPGEVSAATLPPATNAAITFFQDADFRGPSITSRQPITDFRRAGLNGRVQSVEVVGATWEVCPDRQFSGQCMLLRPGRYPTLASMGLREQIESARVSELVSSNDRPRRGQERTFEAPVTAVRAVVGTPEQRCWVDQEQASNNPNVPAAIAGALLGGILGHQVGGGTGKDVATIGGVVAGAAIGSRIGNGRGETREVQRCEQIPAQARTQYWDVTYNFRGLEHRVQLDAAPGRTVTVDESGELAQS